ncbi:MAG: hypothetical protein OXF84_04725, partial [Bacteroidetes bacterium]|nr:hypothetical protein [Bacteroidota bacterium]
MLSTELVILQAAQLHVDAGEIGGGDVVSLSVNFADASGHHAARLFIRPVPLKQQVKHPIPVDLVF